MQGTTLQDDGIHQARKQVVRSGTSVTLTDAKTDGAYVCNKKVAGNLAGQTLTFGEEVTDAVIEYELAEEEIIPYSETQATQYNAIKQAKSYDDQTNISQTNDDLPFILDITALKK